MRTNLTADDLTAVTIAAREALRTRTADPTENPRMYKSASGDPLDTVVLRTAGEVFTESDAYKAWRGRFPDGGPATSGQFSSDPVLAKGGYRALVTGASDTAAGALVPPDFRGLLEPGSIRPLRLRQLVTVLPASGDVVTYVRETSRVSGAAPVAEAWLAPLDVGPRNGRRPPVVQVLQPTPGQSKVTHKGTVVINDGDQKVAVLMHSDGG